MHNKYRICGDSVSILVDGPIQQTVKLGAEGFFKSIFVLPPSRSIDLLRIAIGIYTVDRICKRKRTSNNEHGIRQLHLIFDVDDISFWRQPDISNRLLGVVKFLTDDDWQLDFELRSQTPWDLGYTKPFDLKKSGLPKYAALYSGGLDSAAGLVNRILTDRNDFLLITVDHQRSLHQLATRQLRELKCLIKELTGSEVEFLHTTLKTNMLRGKAKRMSYQEQTQRSRAFLFCTVAAIAAKAHNLETVEIFENGVGAINLPVMTGMLGSGLATRGAHPVFLKLMSEFASLVNEAPLAFTLPFKTHTKAEVMRPLGGIKNFAQWLQNSRSCVHTSIREKGKTHCGECAACIERRQAFTLAGIEEDIESYQIDIVEEKPKKKDNAAYSKLSRHDAQKWLNGASDVRTRLSKHLCLTDVPGCEFAFYEDIQQRHAHELLTFYRPQDSIHT